MEQEKQLDLETRIRNLRAEGKTYREIAEILHTSIAHISRTLKSDHQKGGEARTRQGEMAAQVFRLLEEGCTLPQVVIKLELEPEIIEDLYNKWARLKEIDVNQPNLERLDEELKSHIFHHGELDHFLEKAMEMGAYRRQCCHHANPNGSCTSLPNTEEDEMVVVRCLSCHGFKPREEDKVVITI